MAKPKKKVFTVDVADKEFAVPAEVFDDVELMDDLRRLQEGDATLTLTVMRGIFGTDTNAVMDALRDDAGKVRFAAVSDVFERLFAGAAPNS